MKENDIILNMLANPKFTLEDFQAVGLNSDNTGLQSEDKYLQSDKIKSVSAFQDSNGQFDKNKFPCINVSLSKVALISLSIVI